MIAHNAKYNNPEYIRKRFGNLVVKDIRHEPSGKPYRWMWLCKCDCGKEKWIRADALTSGHSKTCGCGKRYDGATVHGESKTRLYMIWGRMIERCSPHSRYGTDRYAKRGISVCEEWKDYEQFVRWAKENGYSDNLSIERIDNNGNYCPGNCKWIEQKKQARNRETTHWVEYNGRRMSLAEACEIADMSYKTVHARITQLGWSVEEALSVPIGHHGSGRKTVKARRKHEQSI